MTTRIGLIGVDSSHAEDFLRHFNLENRHAGLRITSIADGEATRMDELRHHSPGVMASSSVAELIGSVDAVIIGHRHGDLHRKAAIASLAAGRPTFVDKPLANSVADAEAIVEASRSSGAPLLSGSALRWQAETARLKARIVSIDDDFELLAYGTWYPQSEYGGAVFYAIHTIELVQELLGTEWKKLKAQRGETTRVQFKAGGRDVTLELRPLGSSGSSDFGVEVRSRSVSFKQTIPLGDDYMAPVAAKITKMIESGRSCLSAQQMLAPVRFMHEVDCLLMP